MTSSRRFIDLSHTVADGLATYPGLPAVHIRPHLTREASRDAYEHGTEFAIDVIEMVGNTGTYLDSPFHRYDDGADLADLPLESLVDLPAVVIDATGAPSRGVGVDALEGLAVRGAAVLVRTGWDVHFATPGYAIGAPFLTGEAAEALVAAGAVLVGIDSLNIDDTESRAVRPAHSALLAAGVPVVEHLTGLGALPATGARFTAVPPKVRGFGTFPVRAFATVDAG